MISFNKCSLYCRVPLQKTETPRTTIKKLGTHVQSLKNRYSDTNNGSAEPLSNYLDVSLHVFCPFVVSLLTCNVQKIQTNFNLPHCLKLNVNDFSFYFTGSIFWWNHRWNATTKLQRHIRYWFIQFVDSVK